jgi:antitoxin component YwqK of YwqJK toxin-antitoxin module
MAKKAAPVKLRFSRIDFYRLRGQEFFEELFKRVERFLGDGRSRGNRWNQLNACQQGVYAWWCFWGDVLNGGLVQFFYNCADVYVPALHQLLEDTDNAPTAALLMRAAKVYRANKKQFQTTEPWGEEGLFSQMKELNKLDKPIDRLINRTNKNLEKWLRANFARFALGDLGQPIEAKFTGEIETCHANGKVFEQASVRRGVLSGRYRRYLDDGTLEHTCFYEAGELSTNYWPNGQPKHKALKRGKTKVNEWYYPSGKLQKRFTSDKTGNAVEPVRMWYENGQLAEELHTQGRDPYGPWLKFFDDGAPQLEAEYRDGQTLVVKNAWDNERRQIVKNGSGTYAEDGCSINWPYDLYFKTGWIRSGELRDGIPNGSGTTYAYGVLWSRGNYVDGKPDGVHTSYYDNGRIRSETTYRNGKGIETKRFPKFDNPRPAVLLQVEADAKLYEAWKLPLLDAYPTPRNRDEIQAQLPIPKFLEEVYQRNLSNSIREEYEDINTFKDGNAYLVMVSDDGNVASVHWSGSSAYSGSTINDYPPFIEKLKFEPGRLRGSPMQCRVLVRVDHTFVESVAKP